MPSPQTAPPVVVSARPATGGATRPEAQPSPAAPSDEAGRARPAVASSSAAPVAGEEALYVAGRFGDRTATTSPALRNHVDRGAGEAETTVPRGALGGGALGTVHTSSSSVHGLDLVDGRYRAHRPSTTANTDSSLPIIGGRELSAGAAAFFTRHGRLPRILDTYCCGGGAGMGYHQAGFDVVGVDVAFQKHYPFAFHQADAIAFIRDHGHEFDAVHGSPPCQRYTKAQRLRSNDHPDLIGPTREAVLATGLPYVIENVAGARAQLIAPAELCGCMFPGLGVYRTRLFEAPWLPLVPPHSPHLEPVTKMGRPPKPGERMHVVGNFSGVAAARKAMGIDWMTRDELRESIPPAYTRFLGEVLLDVLAPAGTAMKAGAS